MLGTLTKTVSQAATSQGYFLKWQLPNGAFSLAITSQVCSSHSACPLAHHREFRKLHIWEDGTWEVALGGKYLTPLDLAIWHFFHPFLSP